MLDFEWAFLGVIVCVLLGLSALAQGKRGSALMFGVLAFIALNIYFSLTPA